MRTAPTALIAALCLAGCAAPGQPRQYAATIVEVVRPQGALLTQYLRPNGGPETGPLTVLRLRIAGNGPPAGALVEIVHVGAYEPALMGAAGQRVAFSYRGALPARGEIDEGSIASYEVLP
ncbi:MAG TPA: hypothetical protein VGG34_08270 [Opitutaceae bacterium]